MNSSSFYDIVADEYESYCAISHVNTFLEDDIKLAQEYNPSSILEFGIGDGRFAKVYLKKHPHTVYIGIDNSKNMLNYAKNSGAILIHDNFQTYIKKLIKNSTIFDLIIAPYSVIHHIETGEQFELFENMKQVANVIIINCVTGDKEKELFKNQNKTEITFTLQNGNYLKTTVHTLHKTIRKEMQVRNIGGERESLVWEKL